MLTFSTGIFSPSSSSSFFLLSAPRMSVNALLASKNQVLCTLVRKRRWKGRQTSRSQPLSASSDLRFDDSSRAVSIAGSKLAIEKSSAVSEVQLSSRHLIAL